MSLSVSSKRRRHNQVGLLDLDVPTILNSNLQYETPRELMIRKIKGLIDFPETDNWTHRFKDQVYYHLYKQSLASKRNVFRHSKYDWLCANVDSIDNNQIVKIECPQHRDVNGPVPNYFWIIIQIQLEILNINSCKFIQANVIKSDKKSDYYSWRESSDITTCGRDFRSSQLYYWAIKDLKCTTITRDSNWFNEYFPVIEDFWQQVLHYRGVGIGQFIQDHPRTELFGRTVTISESISDIPDWDWNSMNRDTFIDLIESKTITQVNLDDWVAPTKLRNWFKGEPLLDWLKHNTTRLNPVTNETIRKNHSKFLMHRGDKFEASVFEYLSNNYQTRLISTGYAPINKVPETVQAMKDGIPIILQGVLYNPQNRTYGAADILIRVDYIKQVFPETELTDQELQITAPGINNQLHYRVIDVKSRVLGLSSQGHWFKGSHKGSSEAAFKAQLAIYNQALGFLQGHTPNTAYLLGTGYKFIKTISSVKNTYRSNNSLARLGEIKFNVQDADILEYIPQALNWYRKLRKEGHNWTLSPRPCIPELWPNMCNDQDAPFHRFKIQLANELKEITQIRNCSVKHRTLAHSSGIYSWDHPKLTPEILGFNEFTKSGAESVQYKQVMSILNANRDQSDQVLFPDKITSNINNWQDKYGLEMYIDFEDTHLSFLEDFSNYPTVDYGQVIFMIGLEYYDPLINKFIYKNFTTPDVSIESERNMLRSWFEFMKDNSRLNEKIRLFHYSHHERTLFEKLESRYPELYDEFNDTLNRIIWIDVYKDIFMDNLICVKGALDWSLKNIAGKMREHGLISSGWDTSSLCTSGGEANVLAAVCHKKSKRLNVSMTEFPEIKDTQIYNSYDCIVLQEIVECLRNYYV